MSRVHRWLASASILAVLGAACGAVGGDQATPPPVFSSPAPPAPQPARAPVLNPSPDSSANAEAQAIDAATRDAAARLSLATSDIHVQRVEARQWPDSALGCPGDGGFYSQVVTPGYLVVISGAGKQLEYHADSRGRVVFCQEL